MTEEKYKKPQDNGMQNQRVRGTKNNRFFNLLLLLAAFFLTCGYIYFGAYFRAEHDLHDVAVGQPSRVSILATRNVVNNIATERNRQDALVRANAQGHVTALNPQTWPLEVEHTLNILNNSLTALRELHDHETQAFMQRQTDIDIAFETLQIMYEHERGIWEALRQSILADNGNVAGLPDEPIPPIRQEPLTPDFEVWQRFELLPVRMNQAQQEFILSIDDDSYNYLWEVVMDVAYTVQLTHIEEVNAIVLEVMRDQMGTWALDQDTREIVDLIIRMHLTPNVIVDEERTQSNWERTRDDYEEVTLVYGQSVVNVGEIITDEIYDILHQLGLLGEVSFADILVPIIGVIIIVALLFLACTMFLSFYRPTIGSIKKEAFLLFTLYVLVLSLVWALNDFQYVFLPILIFPMLVSVLIERRSALVISPALVIVCYFIVDGSLEYLFFFLIASVLVSLFSRFTTDRSKIFVVGTAVLLLQFALAVSIIFITQRDQALYSPVWLFTTAGYAALNGLLTVIICTGSLPIWESFFGVVTPVKLLDLTNPSNLLLRRLTIEAPGTYHHSLIVSNLAESAAYDIGANAHAARVGGYYHDVGKLKYPHYFAENLDGGNPHDDLKPADSADIIIGHVSHGLRLAAEHKLPQFVRDIIQEYHGGSVLQYFYHKAVESGETVDEADYVYQYSKPQTKESACVMLADSVEAAVRSMMPKFKTADEMENTVRVLMRNKLIDGLLADSQLSIRDLADIELSFVRVLKGMYHERIAYPKPVPVEEAESVISPSEV